MLQVYFNKRDQKFFTLLFDSHPPRSGRLVGMTTWPPWPGPQASMGDEGNRVGLHVILEGHGAVEGEPTRLRLVRHPLKPKYRLYRGAESGWERVDTALGWGAVRNTFLMLTAFNSGGENK